jgi:hypothetical protein
MKNSIFFLFPNGLMMEERERRKSKFKTQKKGLSLEGKMNPFGI